jgi:hypothetical protein
MHLNHIYELSTLLLGAGWRYDTRRSLQTLPSQPPRMRSWMDEEAGEAVASDGVGARGAGEGGKQALLYVCASVLAGAIMRVQRRWWPVSHGVWWGAVVGGSRVGVLKCRGS